MRINIYIIIISVSSLFISSCDDFLTVDNPNKLSTEKFPVSYEDCKKQLNSVYNAFNAPEIYQLMSENMRSDVAIQGGVARHDNITFTSNAQNFNDVSSEGNQKWAALYEGIFRANQLLEGVNANENKVTLQSQIDDLKSFKAQAYFFRGLFYFWLWDSFNNGSVPIIDYVPKTKNEYYQPLSSSEKVVDFVMNDLQKAIDSDALPKSSHDGHITHWAAVAVLAKCYLYQGNYSKAAELFKKIIDSGEYTLEGVSPADNITTRGEFNKESILEVSYSTSYNAQTSDNLYNNWNMQFGVGIGSYGGTCIPPMWLVEEAEYDRIDPKQSDNWLSAKIDDKGNLIYVYDAPGKSVEYKNEYNSTDNSYKFIDSYVFQKRNGDFNDGYIHYSNEVMKRTLKIRISDNSIVSDTYVSVKGNPKVLLGRVPNTNYYSDESSVYPNPTDILVKDINGTSAKRLRYYSPRSSYSFAILGDEDLDLYSEPNAITFAYPNGITGTFRKMSNWDIWKSENDGTPTNASSINLRLIRLADVYLMYAECLIEGGSNDEHFQEALEYVNKVRQRAGVCLIGKNNGDSDHTYTETYDIDIKDGKKNYNNPIFIETAQQLMAHIMYVERPLELCVEGHAIRLNDIRRWKITKDRFRYLSQDKGYTISGISVIGYDVNNNLTALSRWSRQFIGNDPTRLSLNYSDYKVAYSNYNDTKAYWPIPNKEVLANPFIN